MVGQDDGDHRLGHRDEPRQEARVVPAFGADGRRPPLVVDRLLLDGEAARRFDGRPQDNAAGRW